MPVFHPREVSSKTLADYEQKPSDKLLRRWRGGNGKKLNDWIPLKLKCDKFQQFSNNIQQFTKRIRRAVSAHVR